MNEKDRQLAREAANALERALKRMQEALESLRILSMTASERKEHDTKEKEEAEQEIRERAEKIAKCGESAKGHKWEGNTDDGGYYVCQKCHAYTNTGIPLVFLSFYDRVSGASEARTLPKELQNRICLSRGKCYATEGVEPYG